MLGKTIQVWPSCQSLVHHSFLWWANVWIKQVDFHKVRITVFPSGGKKICVSHPQPRNLLDKLLHVISKLKMNQVLYYKKIFYVFLRSQLTTNVHLLLWPKYIVKLHHLTWASARALLSKLILTIPVTIEHRTSKHRICASEYQNQEKPTKPLPFLERKKLSISSSNSKVFVH